MPVGTGDEVDRLILEVNSKAEFVVVSDLELLREVVAIGETKRHSRAVIGVEDPRSKAVMEKIYRPSH